MYNLKYFLNKTDLFPTPGTALCDQYLQNAPLEASRELATRLECSTDSGRDIINCLQRKSQQEIISAAQQMFVSLLVLQSYNHPVLQSYNHPVL